MLYTKLFPKMEAARWSLQLDVPWGSFSRGQISDRQLWGIKMNCILEWSAMPTAEMFLRDNQGDADFSAFVSIWFFEEQKHSLVLMEYLQKFAPDLVPSEEELSRVRFTFDPAPALESLALHFCGEIRLHHWYRCARQWHTEPVIRHIYNLLAKDEARHARAYFEYMLKAVARCGDDARRTFSRIGVLMSNPRTNKAMHPTNLHVSKALFPGDTVNDRLPDPHWLANWLNTEIQFDQDWERQVTSKVLFNLSKILGIAIESPYQLLRYKDSLHRSL